MFEEMTGYLLQLNSCGFKTSHLCLKLMLSLQQNYLGGNYGFIRLLCFYFCLTCHTNALCPLTLLFPSNSFYLISFHIFWIMNVNWFALKEWPRQKSCVMFKISNRKEYPYYLDIFSFLLMFFLCRTVDSSTNFKR